MKIKVEMEMEKGNEVIQESLRTTCLSGNLIQSANLIFSTHTHTYSYAGVTFDIICMYMYVCLLYIVRVLVFHVIAGISLQRVACLLRRRESLIFDLIFMLLDR